LDASLHWSDEALNLAQELAHPYSLAWALQRAARLHQYRREVQRVHERTEAFMTLCTAHGFSHYIILGTILRGWVLASQGHAEEGITQLRQGLDSFQAVGGGTLDRPLHNAWLAEAYGNAGRVQEGLRLLAEAQTTVDTTGERWYEPELYRLQGELHRKHPIPDAQQAEAGFHSALDIARQQQAKLLELRTAMSPGRLWQRQDKHTEARQLLAPIHGWFTEGFDTPDLQEAKALLETLV